MLESPPQETAVGEYPAGILCPVCQRSDWKTTHTRRGFNRVRRFKTCLHCGTKIRTAEVLEAGPHPERDAA